MRLAGGASLCLLASGCGSGGSGGGGGLFSEVGSLFGFGGGDGGGDEIASGLLPPGIPPGVFPPVLPPQIPPTGGSEPPFVGTLFNPEPSSLALFGMGSGLIGLASLRRKSRKRTR
ncbi:MAG TPA: hypothetical protein DDX89_01740 [Candidatus Omnitrophica bacterium]|nr:MAG: hypothetical protein A2Z92_03595 [Omnitrophica WOR_2 bacterium GWA2_63_20]OGX45530.1 MAG: hypothetical protein A3I71_04725 [Omnitrophica WOR_2 bacterium RIFCSPLOWO2_02_FULL_63_16]OGX49568.1 MAG: hypothetical protein A3G88_00070 [Omnitrophica WOR_2 bacterium RIFCSPLOWO2_12_FULL_63_16]HBH96501.1 hypothetical protein [Candidatus Omnitrophota bacterium]